MNTTVVAWIGGLIIGSMIGFLIADDGNGEPQITHFAVDSKILENWCQDNGWGGLDSVYYGVFDLDGTITFNCDRVKGVEMLNKGIVYINPDDWILQIPYNKPFV